MFLPVVHTYRLQKQTKILSIAQAVGNVASTALNAAEEMISGAGGLINPQTHGDDYAEMAWQHKLRNQAKKKKKRGRSIMRLSFCVIFVLQIIQKLF